MAKKKTTKKAAKKTTGKKVGRPTKYLKKYTTEAYKYLDRCKDIEDEFWKTRGEKSDSYERTLTVQLPTIEGLALCLKVAVSTIYLWAKDHPEFSEALGTIKAKQKERLIEKGLSGDYSPVIAKLILSANHGMREKSDVTTDGKELPVPIIPLNVQGDNSNNKDKESQEED